MFGQKKRCLQLPPYNSDTHYVSGGQAKVEDDGAESEQVAGAIVLMHPAAELLHGCGCPLEFLSQSQQQQQHVDEQEDGKLEDGWEQSAGGWEE